MRDLIYRQDAVKALIRESTRDGAYGYVDTKSAVEIMTQLPSVEPERKKGKWNQIISIPKDMYGRYYCSECGKEGNSFWNFCPNCRADMRGDSDEIS